jgi:plasmid stabilization system protein ParE
LFAIAEQDLVELVSYLAAENPKAAADVLDHLEARLQTLTSPRSSVVFLRLPNSLRLGIAFLSLTTIWLFTK